MLHMFGNWQGECLFETSVVLLTVEVVFCPGWPLAVEIKYLAITYLWLDKNKTDQLSAYWILVICWIHNCWMLALFSGLC
jgi:hypothetical protein